VFTEEMIMHQFWCGGEDGRNGGGWRSKERTLRNIRCTILKAAKDREIGSAADFCAATREIQRFFGYASE
jgi:hypothetical protein